MTGLQRNIEFERCWLYMPRNLSKCSESDEELLKHVKKKTKILDQYIRLKPRFFLPSLRRERLKSTDQEIVEAFNGDTGSTTDDDDDEEDENSNFIIRKRLNKQQATNFDTTNRLLIGIQRRKSDLSVNCNKRSDENSRKIVRFADTLGLELEHTRLILNSDLPPDIAQVVRDAYKRAYVRRPVKILTPNFDLSLENNDRKSLLNFVYLNSFRIFDGDNCLIGDILVRNIVYEKYVFVRYTLDEWISYADFECNWISSDRNNNTTKDWDLFGFCIFMPMERFSGGRKLHFAICYQSDGNEYWDNNCLKNYTVECYERPKSPWDRI